MTGRIHGSEPFRRTRAEGTRVRSTLVWCTMLPDSSLTRPHVGYAIGRSAGGAVTRNRMRRRLRALFRAHTDDLRPGWYVVAASPEVASCPAQRLRDEVDTLVAKLARVGVR